MVSACPRLRVAPFLARTTRKKWGTCDIQHAPSLLRYQIMVTTPVCAMLFALWMMNVSVLFTRMSTRWLKSK